jgi:hypothetical protein
MRVVDIQLSFPAILIALILIAVLGQGTGKVITALVTIQWAYYARTVRSAALVEKRKEYMEAARCLALSPARIVFRHLLPNCLPPMIVVATVQGRRRNRTGSHALVPRPGTAHHRAVARPPHRQRLPISPLRESTGSASSRALRCSSPSSASTSSPTSCATFSILDSNVERT